MNQTWPLDFSFMSGEKQAKKTKHKGTHILCENEAEAVRWVWVGPEGKGSLQQWRRAPKAEEMAQAEAQVPQVTGRRWQSVGMR